MLWNTVWRNWRNKIGEGKRVHRRRPALARACLAEVLEDRCLLSTITVTTLSDNLSVDGQVTLREAIQAANTNAAVDGSTAGQSGVQDEIIFQDGLVGTVHLNAALGQLVISDTVKITGLGAKDTAVDAGQNSRVFSVTNTAGDVGFDALTISGGKTTAVRETGAGIRFLSTGALTITNSSISGNTTTAYESRGGAIYTDVGAVRIQNSLLSGNTTTGQSGRGIAIYSKKNAPLTLINSTVSGNTASGYHGGASIYTVGGLGSLTMINSTVTANFGIGNLEVGSGGISLVRGAATIRNSIISGNFAQDGREFDIGISGYAVPSTFTARHSLIGVNGNHDGAPLAPAPIGHPDANGNYIGTYANPIDAMLLPLADNGGPTMTHAILGESPVIDAGDNALALGLDGLPLTTDQRGPGFPRIDHVIVDMGAFEGHYPDYPPLVPNAPLVVTTATDELDGDLSNPGDLSLREAIAIANSTFGPDKIVFDTSLSGVPLKLSLGQLTVTDDLTIEGLGPQQTIIDAQKLSRVIDVALSGTDLTLDFLTVTGGKTTADFEQGGGIRMRWAGNLTIERSSISGNTTTGEFSRGGGIFAYGGNTVIVDSLISGNSTSGLGSDGGGIYTNNSALVLTNSTLSGNTTSGYHADGAGIYSWRHVGSVTLTNATVTDNNAIGTEDGGSGGIVVIRAAVTFRNSIISGNHQKDGTEIDISISGYADPSTFSSSHSLIGFGINRFDPIPPAPVGHPDANGNFVGTLADPIDAMLSSLFEGGAGWTRSHKLLPGSPAINAGDNTLAVDPNGNPLEYDQRGPRNLRILWHTVDMGATEAFDLFAEAPFPRLASIEGFYRTLPGDRLAQILRVGDTLTFVDPIRGTSSGHVVDATHVVATDWGIQGTFLPESGVLALSDFTFWRNFQRIEGRWFNGIGGEVGIRQLGTELVFTNVFGQSAAGTYLPNGLISVPDWGVTGGLSIDGQTIAWSNGRDWTLIPDLQGNWVNGNGAPTRIEQQGLQLLFVNRFGQTSLGEFVDPITIRTGAEWGFATATLVDGKIEWSTGVDWTQPTLTAGYPDLGGLWQTTTTGADVRVLQADQTLTFVNRFGQTSAGHFLSPTQVMADDWVAVGTLTDSRIAWDNGIDWDLVPGLAGAYLNETNSETGLNQLERTLKITNEFGVVTHGNLVGLTQIVETDGLQRTATIAGNVITWNNGPVWTHRPELRGDWSLDTNGDPTYIEQAGLRILLVGSTGKIYVGDLVSPTAAEVSEVGPPSPPVINVGIVSDNELDFDGTTWNKSIVNNLDAYFASPNDWPFV